MINNVKNTYKNTNYSEDLKVIVTHLNDLLGNVMDKVIIHGFNGFLGKYFHNEIKREIYDLIYANEGVYIFKIDYYTNFLQEIPNYEAQIENSEEGKELVF